jgi:putative acetyltransferase
MRFTIRPEKPGDEGPIADITTAAFVGHPHSAGTEAAIVDALRKAGVMTVSLVAVSENGRIIGHVAFSPIVDEHGTAGWFGLGPVSVLPDQQRRGVGSALIEDGLDRLRSAGARGCALVGDAGYYRRFGFDNDAAATLEGVPPEYFMVLCFGANRLSGLIRFHPAFNVRK